MATVKRHVFEGPAPQRAPDAQDVIAYGREVAELESSALALLAQSLDDTFARAVALMLTLRGRMVITGIGKSGHVARKIAATLSSTGSPALFIHPAEAAHGDLGMLMPGDALLALSNSGASRELQPILAHAKLLGVPIVGITAHASSPLADQVDICLMLPPADEACPVNLAPTTSTAMMMALGDALAMAAMRVRGVSRDGFEALHPGGVIGARLTRVSAVMHGLTEMPLVAVTAPMREVIVTMTTCSFGVAGVVNAEGNLIGVITDGDLRRHVDDLMHSTATDVMTRDPVTIGARDSAEDALTTMNEHKITSLFVAAQDNARRPIGIVHVHDLLRLGFA